MTEHKVGEIWVNLLDRSNRFGEEYEVLAITSYGIRVRYLKDDIVYNWDWECIEDDKPSETEAIKRILKSYE